jgi:VanZ family protein
MQFFVKYWLPLLIWLGVIFIGSSDLMSAEHTSRIIDPFLRWLKPDISAETIAQVQFFVRKTAHLTEYGILAMLSWRAIFRGTNLKPQTSIAYLALWLATILVAASDEYHQSFVASRTAAYGDVLIDSGGALFGLIISASWSRRRDRRNLKSAT